MQESTATPSAPWWDAASDADPFARRQPVEVERVIGVLLGLAESASSLSGARGARCSGAGWLLPAVATVLAQTRRRGPLEVSPRATRQTAGGLICVRRRRRDADGDDPPSPCAQRIASETGMVAQPRATPETVGSRGRGFTSAPSGLGSRAGSGGGGGERQPFSSVSESAPQRDGGPHHRDGMRRKPESALDGANDGEARGPDAGMRAPLDAACSQREGHHWRLQDVRRDP